MKGRSLEGFGMDDGQGLLAADSAVSRQVRVATV
jgi:hypothetical protein